MKFASIFLQRVRCVFEVCLKDTDKRAKKPALMVSSRFVANI